MIRNFDSVEVREPMVHKTIYRKDIQVLRGIAVMAVILFHAEKNFFPLGYLGVDLFFVISGLVVAPLIVRIFEDPYTGIQAKLDPIKDFYIKRFYRLAPAFVGILFFTSIMLLMLGSSSDHERIAKQGIAALFMVGNLGAYKYNMDYFSPNPNPLLHTWSLSVEEQIYLVLPVLILIILVISREIKNFKIFFLRFSLGLSFLSFISFIFPGILKICYEFIGIYSASQFSFYSPVSRVWQFLLGGVLSVFLTLSQRGGKNWKINKYFYFIGLGLLCLCLFSQIQLATKFGSILVTVLTLFVVSQINTPLRPNRLRKVLIWLGDRSYSLYLIHMPMLYIAKYSQVFEFSANSDRKIQILIAIFSTLVLGNYSFVFIENRFRSKNSVLTKKINKIQVITILISLLLVFIGMSKTTSLEIFRDSNHPVYTGVSPQNWDVNCKFHQPSNPPRNRPCFYGSKMFDKNFLLIGDSHAGHLSKTIINVSQDEKANVYIFTHSACPFITNPKVLKFKNKYPLLTAECLRHNNQILHFLDQVKIDTIFYTQRSTVPYVVPNHLESRNIFNNFVKQSLSQLNSYDIRIVFLGITPEYISVDSLIPKLLSRKGFYNEIPGLDNIFWKKQLSGSQINYVDVYSKFCPSLTRCNNQKNNQWLFVDNDHLSLLGGKFIEPQIIGALE